VRRRGVWDVRRRAILTSSRHGMGYASRCFQMDTEEYVPVTGVVNLHTALGIFLDIGDRRIFFPGDYIQTPFRRFAHEEARHDLRAPQLRRGTEARLSKGALHRGVVGRQCRQRFFEPAAAEPKSTLSDAPTALPADREIATVS